MRGGWGPPAAPLYWGHARPLLWGTHRHQIDGTRPEKHDPNVSSRSCFWPALQGLVRYGMGQVVTGRQDISLWELQGHTARRTLAVLLREAGNCHVPAACTELDF